MSIGCLVSGKKNDITKLLQFFTQKKVSIPTDIDKINVIFDHETPKNCYYFNNLCFDKWYAEVCAIDILFGANLRFW